MEKENKQIDTNYKSQGGHGRKTTFPLVAQSIKIFLI